MSRTRAMLAASEKATRSGQNNQLHQSEELLLVLLALKSSLSRDLRLFLASLSNRLFGYMPWLGGEKG